MKVYSVYRRFDGVVATVGDPADIRPLKPRFDLRNHSPTGFEFGYEGSGPAQLSLAILADCLGEADALRLYQRFKREVVARQDATVWEITEEQVKEWRDRCGNG